jgi:hypothetical protein
VTSPSWLRSEAHIGERRGPIRVVLDEDDPILPERECLVQLERSRRLRSRIHDHGVADLGEHDRVARRAGGEETLEHLAHLVSICAERRLMIVVVMLVVVGVVMGLVCEATPNHSLVEEADEPLEISGFEGSDQ